MFCIKCGQELPDDAEKCTNCGFSTNESNLEPGVFASPTALVPAQPAVTPENASIKKRKRKRVAIIVTAAVFLIILVNLSFAMVFSMLPIDGFSIRIGDHSVTITKYVGHKEDVIIPDRLLFLPVKNLSNEHSFSAYSIVFNPADTGAFMNNSKVKTVKIGKYVGRIGPDSFQNCVNLKKVEISDSVTTIESGAFVGCSSLVDIKIPKSVKHIANDAFFGTAWRDNYPNACIIEGDGILFDYIGDSKNLIIPNNAKIIGENALESAKNIVSLTISKNVDEIGDSAFSECSNLKNISIPGSVKTIDADAFFDCNSLLSVSIPDSVKNIGDYAFGYKQNSIYEAETLLPGFKIHCSAGSAGYQYAKDNGIDYVLTKQT